MRELVRLAVPLVLSNSFWTIQITVDRMFLARLGPDEVSASMAAALVFWSPFILLQMTVSFATTFVAQYSGAGRNDRIGPVVWQSIWFGTAVGLAFLGFLPFTGTITGWLGHGPAVTALEAAYLECLCWMAWPALLTAAVSSFFAGRGDSWTIVWINAAGTAVNVVTDWALIFGNAGFPAMGIAGAGWATVACSWTSALLGLALMMRTKFRAEFATLAGMRWEPALLKRLLRFGLPSGVQFTLDTSAFTAFVIILGWFGSDALAASTIAFTINTFAFMPMLGVGQAAAVLVGKRLGEDRPDLAEASTWRGLQVALVYMGCVAGVLIGAPAMLTDMFRSDSHPERFASVAAMVPTMLVFVACYAVCDAVYVVFSFALRGAGDTDFVSRVSLFTSWPMMVAPTWLFHRAGFDVLWAWGAASVYITFIAVVLLLRFLAGKWKTMRVIEPVAIEDVPPAAAAKPAAA